MFACRKTSLPTSIAQPNIYGNMFFVAVLIAVFFGSSLSDDDSWLVSDIFHAFK